MKLVYIAGKYSDPDHWLVHKNIEAAKEVALKYAKQGCAFFCPHTNSAFMGGGIYPNDYEGWMKIDFEILSRCDAVVFMNNWKDSKGAVREHEYAKQLGKEIIYEL